MSPNASITETKSHFLRTQTRLLSTPLQPSPSWQTLSSTTTTTTTSTSPPSSPPTPLPEKTLSDLIAKTNAKIKSHNRLVFSVPSQRHVAEQIDTLYWNEVTSSSYDVTDPATIWVPRDADLSDPAVLGGLPEQIWDDDGDGDDEDNNGDKDNEAKKVQYTELKAKALDLAVQRAELRKKVEAYRGLRAMLAPFEDVKGDVQGNLVGREGELARELERMRVLVARVVGGLGNGSGKGGGDGTGGGGGGVGSGHVQVSSGRERVARVMELD